MKLLRWAAGGALDSKQHFVLLRFQKYPHLHLTLYISKCHGLWCFKYEYHSYYDICNIPGSVIVLFVRGIQQILPLLYSCSLCL